VKTTLMEILSMFVILFLAFGIGDAATTSESLINYVNTPTLSIAPNSAVINWNQNTDGDTYDKGLGSGAEDWKVTGTGSAVTVQVKDKTGTGKMAGMTNFLKVRCYTGSYREVTLSGSYQTLYTGTAAVAGTPLDIGYYQQPGSSDLPGTHQITVQAYVF
jgi:hypothetical protein